MERIARDAQNRSFTKAGAEKRIFSPRAGRAEVATRIRLASTQTVLVLAETSGGRVHRASREVIVILGACVDGG